MTIRDITKLSGVLLFAITISACVTPGPVGVAYVRFGPPGPVYEVRTVAPGAGYVWIAGYHRWDGRGYVWVPGRWELPPRRGARWVAGRWLHDGRQGWYWREGYWR